MRIIPQFVLIVSCNKFRPHQVVLIRNYPSRLFQEEISNLLENILIVFILMRQINRFYLRSLPTNLSNIRDERDQHGKDDEDPNSDEDHLSGSQASSFIAR